MPLKCKVEAISIKVLNIKMKSDTIFIPNSLKATVYIRSENAIGPLQQRSDRDLNALGIQTLMSHLLPQAATAFRVGAYVIEFPFEACLQQVTTEAAT